MILCAQLYYNGGSQFFQDEVGGYSSFFSRENHHCIPSTPKSIHFIFHLPYFSNLQKYLIENDDNAICKWALFQYWHMTEFNEEEETNQPKYVNLPKDYYLNTT